MIKKSLKLKGAGYDIRGVVLEEAVKLEKRGIDVLKLNIGNTAPFGLFPSPALSEVLYKQILETPEESYGYGESKGILSVRLAIKQYYRKKNIALDEKKIYVGNGVSELIQMTLQALINRDDEILIPAPDYPLWTASVCMSGGVPVHYVCDESNEWNPDIDDIAKKITPNTKAIVIINPNNPTGAVYTKEILLAIVALAMKHNLLIFSDEIYERVIYDDAQMHYMAELTGDYPCIFFNGLSKAYRAPGLRMGWAGIHDPKNMLADYLVGLEIVSNMRLCSNMLAQHTIPIALQHDNEIDILCSPQGRLYKQRQIVIDALREMEGVEVVCPKGAMYAFPKFDKKKFGLHDDEKMVLDLLHKKHILLVHGGAFHHPNNDHIRIVFLPDEQTLGKAMHEMKDFFMTYQQV